MKQFISRVSLFFLLSFSVFAVLLGIYAFKMNYFKFKLPKDKIFLFLGDSHFETCIDENQIPGACNFGKSADCSLNQYLRVQKFLNSNRQIKVLFLTVTPHSIAEYGDCRMYDPNIIVDHIPYYFPLHREEEFEIYWAKLRQSYFLNCIDKPFMLARNSLFQSEKRLQKKMGGFLGSRRKNLVNDVAGIYKKRLNGDKTLGNKIQLRYLHKILDIAQSKNVKVVFVNTPIYKAEKYFDLSFFYKTLQREFPDVEFWDYMNWECPDDYRQDINHLNKWGAEAFSKEIAERMKREGLLPNEK